MNDRLTPPTSSAPQLRKAPGQLAPFSQRVQNGPGETRAGMSRSVACWHAWLRANAVLNVALWSLAALTVKRAQSSIPIDTDAAGMQLLLSAGYVAGCAYRSFLPVIDVPRIALIDSRLSSVLCGRSVATAAELCFAAQWALLLHRLALSAGSPFMLAVSFVAVPLIVLAEICSWYAVLTTAQRAHAAENSLWGLAAALAVIGMLVIGPHRSAGLYAATIAGGAAYVAFIFIYDVPMYWSRWRSDQANGHRYLSIADGVVDVSRRWTVSYRWEDWRNEVPWMSLYFTFGVWSSIWLVYATLAIGHRD